MPSLEWQRLSQSSWAQITLRSQNQTWKPSHSKWQQMTSCNWWNGTVKRNKVQPLLWITRVMSKQSLVCRTDSSDRKQKWNLSILRFSSILIKQYMHIVNIFSTTVKSFSPTHLHPTPLSGFFSQRHVRPWIFFACIYAQLYLCIYVSAVSR